MSTILRLVYPYEPAQLLMLRFIESILGLPIEAECILDVYGLYLFQQNLARKWHKQFDYGEASCSICQWMIESMARKYVCKFLSWPRFFRTAGISHRSLKFVVSWLNRKYLSEYRSPFTLIIFQMLLHPKLRLVISLSQENLMVKPLYKPLENVKGWVLP